MDRAPRLIRRVLIANRGEIAVRVIRACREMGIETVAVYSDADAAARHVRQAHAAVRIGPPPAGESYLRADAILNAARESGATLIHPFDDPRVIAGQGTAALELIETIDGLDAVIAPCGGGGLLSGTSIAATHLRERMDVYGATRADDDPRRRTAHDAVAAYAVSAARPRRRNCDLQ